MRDGDDVLAAFDEQCDSADRSRELCDMHGAHGGRICGGWTTASGAARFAPPQELYSNSPHATRILVDSRMF